MTKVKSRSKKAALEGGWELGIFDVFFFEFGVDFRQRFLRQFPFFDFK